MLNFRGVSYPWEGTVDGSEILHQPVEVGSLSHNLGRVFTSQVVQDIFHPSIISWRITARWAEFCPFHSFTGKLAERCFDKSVSWTKSRIIFKGARVNFFWMASYQTMRALALEPFFNLSCVARMQYCLELQAISFSLWLFQLDDSKSLHKNGCFTKHPLNNCCFRVPRWWHFHPGLFISHRCDVRGFSSFFLRVWKSRS